MRWPWIRRVYLCGALLPALAIPVAGHAQVDSREGIALQNQIFRLQQELQILRSDVARVGANGGGGTMGGDIGAQLLSRVQAMEEQVRQLRGRIDEAQNLINRQNAELSKRIDDLTFQLNLPGKSAAISPQPAPPPMPAPPPVREVAPRPAPEPPPRPAPEPAPRPDLTPRLASPLPGVISPPPPPPQSFTFNPAPEPMREVPPPPPRVEQVKPVPKPVEQWPKAAPQVANAAPEEPAQIPTDGKRTPELALQEGHAALARRDYQAAERSAREVLANRTSPRVYDGQFLLAQALSGEKQFAQAAIAYDDTYNRSHKGRHAQDALIGLASALTAINEKKAACDTLGRMRTEFPQVRADLLDTITKTNQRAGCGG